MQKNVIASGVATAGVALGIGAAALAFGSGTALAAPSESGSASSSATDSSTKDRDESSTSAAERDSAGSQSEDTDKSEDRDKSEDAEDKDAEDKDVDEKDAETGGAEDEQGTEDDTPDTDVEDAQDDEVQAPADAEVDSDPSTSDGDESAEAPVAAEIPTAGVELEVKERPTASSVSAGAQKITVPRPPVAPAPSLPHVPPTTPLEFVNWVGAQIQRTFFNRTPTTSPVQFVQTDSGQIVGSMRASDFEGDKLVYTLAEGPTRGSLVLHEDGSYTSTPNPSLVAEGGADSFRVEVRDVGWHLNLFNGTGTAASTVVLSVRSDSDVEAPQTSTRGFNIYNLSGEYVVFKGYTKGANRVDSGPAVGTMIAPGANVHVEVVFRFFDDDEVAAQFETQSNGLVTAWMLVTSVDGESLAGCTGTYCSPDTGEYEETSTVIILDAPGTVIEVPAGQGQRQAELLNALCSDGGQATCSFEVGRQEKWFTEGEQASSTFYNDSDATQSISKGASKTEGYSDSLGGNAKFGFKLTEAVNFEIQATYNHTWTTSETWSETITLEVPPWTEASIYASVPMNRVYGDLVINAGNTKWILRDVYFDSPDDSRYAVFRPHYVPIPHEPSQDVAALDL